MRDTAAQPAVDRAAPERWRWAKSAAAAGAIAALAALLWRFDPAAARVFPPCPVHWLAGLHCPGCGSLRAAHALLHGRVGAAFRLNSLMVASIPFLLALALRPSWSRRPWAAWTALAVLVGYGVLRNLPAWPFSWLAPG